MTTSILQRPVWLALASVLVSALAARVLWLAWTFYFGGAPRYRLESAAIALVVIGVIVVLLRSDGLASPREHRDRLPATWLPIFVIAAFCVYWPALRLGLLSDDYSLRAMSESGGFGIGSGWFFRPLPVALWRILLVSTNSAVSLHALNILLHGLNAFLVGVFGTRLGMRRGAALLGASLFVTFPAAPEAVAWASGVQDVLLTTLALGAVIAAGGDRQHRWRTLAACGLLMLGLASKETAICIPALVAISWLAPSRMHELADWRRYLWLGAVAAAYGVARLGIGLSAGYLAAPSSYFVKQLVVLALGTLTTPWRSPSSSATRWLAFGAVLVLTLIATRNLLVWRRSDAPFDRAVRLTLWVLAAVAPVFTYFFVSPQLEGSRYLYLAECGWALLVADLLRTATAGVRWRREAVAGIGGAAIVLSAITVEREIGIWTQAAGLRDRVLTEAHASILGGRCEMANFSNLPDSVAGAYVFRNGFKEALGARDGPVGAVAECDFTWNGLRFVPKATGLSDGNR